MELDFLRFFDACDPSRTLILSNPEDKSYYIDFSSVRGGRVIEALERTIMLRSRLNQPTCQLFTGHVGCGKSTELRRLQADLEERNFHVVFFESTEVLDMADVDVTDILLVITRQVVNSLGDIGINLQPGYFQTLVKDVVEILQMPVDIKELSFSFGLGQITAQAKESPRVRDRLRQYLEPQTSRILEALNNDILRRASEELESREKRGLVVIVDNLDRVDNRPTSTSRVQPEYLFVDRGDQLRKLNCHVVYTIPLSLMFSNEYQSLTNRFGGGVGPKVLPMVPVRRRDRSDCAEGLALLKRMVMVRAFPDADENQHEALVLKVFDAPQSLEHLCRMSGGHVRTLLGMLYRCLQEEDTPLSRSCLDRVIREYRDRARLAVTDEEWIKIEDVSRRQRVSGDDGHDILLRSLFVFEYQDPQGSWFAVNPLLDKSYESDGS
ncbi:MAG: ATP-binding protein [Elainellaceae cyanobacterium]